MLLADCITDYTASYGLTTSLFLAGAVGGVTHCAGMCSPFVLAQTERQGTQSEGMKTLNLKRISNQLLLPYHVGRMMTYVMLAVVFSSVLNLAFLFSGTRAMLSALILMLAGILFLISAFPVLGTIFPWAVKLQWGQPFSWISGLTAKLSKGTSTIKSLMLGVILGFMPCGLVVSAVMAASTAPSPLQAGFSMAAFTVGTMPALMLVALGGGTIKNKYPKLSQRFSQGAMTISALWLFVLAGNLLL